MNIISKFQIIDCGADHAQYFQGFGVSFTEFTECALGAGANYAEALADAIEQIASSGFEIPAAMSESLACAPNSPAFSVPADADEEWFYYVGVRFNPARGMEGRTVTLWDFTKPIKARHSGPCGPYRFTVGALIDSRQNRATHIGGYLNRDASELSEGSHVRLRVELASAHARIRHDGWYTDEFGDSDTINGYVARLPAGRGFLAGYSYGAGMFAEFERDIFDDIADAARAADECARVAAERERETRDTEARDMAADDALSDLRSDSV